MKNVLKISIFALMILCSAMVYSQTNENANLIMQKINEVLSQGDCDQAQKRYNAWKTFADTIDASVESRIAECVKEEKKRQEAGLLMQQINESLSQSDCDDAQLYYNVWKTSSNVSDTAVESRIAECVKAKEKSQQNAATMPNQADKQSYQQPVRTKGNTLIVSTNILKFGSIGGIQTIEISTKAKNYKLYHLPDWIKAFKLPNGDLRIICDENTENKLREESFNIDEGREDMDISVVQEGKYEQNNSSPSSKPTSYDPPIPVNTQQHPAEPDLVYVKGGTFWMGCSDEQGRDCFDDERPPHSVTLSDFYIGKYEVTQKQWQLIMGNNPSNFKGDNLPVEDVSWNDVQEFIRRLNKTTGKQYRLPTEAEWEFACRGGVQSAHFKYSGSNNPNDVAWYNYNSRGITHSVGTKLPNELGIYDMSGNVWEWCQDRYYDAYSSSLQLNPMGASSGTKRVNRGGSFAGNESFVRLSCRNGTTSVDSFYILGFRLACSSNQSESRFSQDE